MLNTKMPQTTFIFIDEEFSVPREEGQGEFVLSVFDGMVYEISNRINQSIASYDDQQYSCNSTNNYGILASIDSPSKLEVLVKLIEKHASQVGSHNEMYLIGNILL